MTERLQLIDGIRGLAIVNMILYHAIWDLVYLYGFDWQWYLGPAGTLWQQAICWTFILVSGFCLPLSSHPVQRGVEVSLAGLAVTMVTLAVMPAARIVFGVLTCIGAAMILCGLAQPLFARLAQHAAVAGSVCFLLFLVTKHVPDGYIGIAGWARRSALFRARAQSSARMGRAAFSLDLSAAPASDRCAACDGFIKNNGDAVPLWNDVAVVYASAALFTQVMAFRLRG